ncbi:shikimate dehydrogenase [Legionella sp.]|uniref:shikimate dehydrogenase n=1 Tax=Legionella sp. TaxID=459 RepID=UPI003C96E566
MSLNFAVVGNPISHSLSPVIHQLFAAQSNIHLTYKKIRSDEYSFEQQVIDFFAQNGSGLNITSPFKQRAFNMAQHITERCKWAKAANTLWINKNRLYADNTDGIGLIRDLRRHIILQKKRVLIIGAGGVVRGILYPLLANDLAELVVTNRTRANAESLQKDFPAIKCKSINQLSTPFDLIINATSASLMGEFVSLPKECLSAKSLCYDLSYKQHEATSFVEYTRNLGCMAVDGLGMLVEQAAEAFFIWHNVLPETDKVLKFLRP